MRHTATKLIKENNKGMQPFRSILFCFQKAKVFSLFFGGKFNSFKKVMEKGKNGFISEKLLSSMKSQPLTCIHD